MNRIILILMMLFFSIKEAWSAGDHYDNSGNIYTVVTCVVVILLGIGFFLFYLERRVSKMEKSIKEESDG